METNRPAFRRAGPLDCCLLGGQVIRLPEPAACCPFQCLDDESMVQPEEGKGPRVFYFTDAGKAHVTEQRTELEAARDAVTSSVDPNALALHDRVHQLAVAVNQVGQVGTRPQLATTQETLIAARRQLYRILADDVPAVDHSDKSITKGGEAYE